MRFFVLLSFGVVLGTKDERAPWPTRPSSAGLSDEVLQTQVNGIESTSQFISAFQALYRTIAEAKQLEVLDRLTPAQMDSWRRIFSDLTGKGALLIGPVPVAIDEASMRTVESFLEMSENKVPLISSKCEDEAVSASLSNAIGQTRALEHAYTRIMTDLVESDLSVCENIAGEVSETPRFLVRLQALRNQQLEYRDSISRILDIISNRDEWSTYPFPLAARKILGTVEIDDFISAFITEQDTVVQFRSQLDSVSAETMMLEDELVDLLPTAERSRAFALLFTHLNRLAQEWTDHEDDAQTIRS